MTGTCLDCKAECDSYFVLAGCVFCFKCCDLLSKTRNSALEEAARVVMNEAMRYGGDEVSLAGIYVHQIRALGAP